MKTRAEHLQWCKDRARKEKGAMNKIASFCSDMNKHPETENHPAMATLMFGHLQTDEDLDKHLEGFN